MTEDIASTQAAIATVVSAYAEAVNSSNTDAVIALYADDGVMMPPYREAVIGAAALRQTYSAGFQAIAFRVAITVIEAVRICPEWAFARSTSVGATTIRATGVSTPETNQELFLLRRSADLRWRIARYSYSPTTPRP